MKKNLLMFLIVLLLLATPFGVRAQQIVSLETLQIDLWAEYDRPSMLVIYRAKLSQNVTFPAQVAFRVPAGAGTPNAVAERPPGGSAINVDYDLEPDGEWAVIRFTASFPDIQIEYYDPGLERDGQSRNFVFRWPGDYAVNQLIMLVQQPTGAEDMQTFPRLTTVTQDGLGLVYFGEEIGSLQAGETFELSLDYQKNSEDLTVNFLPVDSSQPVDTDTEGRVDMIRYLPVGIGILGVGIIAVGVYWYWMSGRKQVRASAKPPRRRRQSLETVEDAVVEDGEFCHQCGKRASSGDRFCRACGSKLRL